MNAFIAMAWMHVFLSLVLHVHLVIPFIFDPIQQGQIRRTGKAVLKCGNIPGMSLAVVRGQESWTLSLGVSNKNTGQPVTDTTNFAIASLTKAFTATLLLTLLRDSNKGYTVDTTLREIVGQESLFPDAVRSQQATVKDILSHRMGLARADLALFAGYPATFSLEDMSRSLHCLPVQSPFRDHYQYSNFMYNLAGHVIEKLSNQSFATAMETRLLETFRMTSSKTLYNITDPDDGMAQPYLTVGETVTPAHHSLFNLRQFLPSLGLASNARDMVKWMRIQLGPYRRHRDDNGGKMKVIADEVITLTHQPITSHINNLLRPWFPASDLTFAYGMGWNQAVYKGFRRIWHSGTLFGFTSFVWLLPDLDIGLFIATNGPSRVPDTRNRLNAFLYFVTDFLLGDPPWLSQSTICSYPLPLGVHQTRPNHMDTPDSERYSDFNSAVDYCTQNSVTTARKFPVEVYTGTYYNKLFGNAHVFPNKTINSDTHVKLLPNCSTGLVIRFGERFQGILLHSMKPHLFLMKPIGIFEFSAHTIDNKLSTMPVEFFKFDKNAIPFSLKAVWQAVEVIQFSRDIQGDECFGSAPTSASNIPSIPGTQLLVTAVTIHMFILHIFKSVYR